MTIRTLDKIVVAIEANHIALEADPESIQYRARQSMLSAEYERKAGKAYEPKLYAEVFECQQGLDRGNYD